MRTLPRAYAPFIYGVVQAAMTTGVATAIACSQGSQGSMEFLMSWLRSWAIAWLTMLPVVIFIAPFLQRWIVTITHE